MVAVEGKEASGTKVRKIWRWTSHHLILSYLSHTRSRSPTRLTCTREQHLSHSYTPYHALAEDHEAIIDGNGKRWKH